MARPEVARVVLRPSHQGACAHTPLLRRRVPERFGRCLGPITPVWISNQGSFATAVASATLDDDGNAAIAFSGSSCAPGNSTVVADVDAGIHSTYSTTFTIVAPTPTI